MYYYYIQIVPLYFDTFFVHAKPEITIIARGYWWRADWFFFQNRVSVVQTTYVNAFHTSIASVEPPYKVTNTSYSTSTILYPIHTLQSVAKMI